MAIIHLNSSAIFSRPDHDPTKVAMMDAIAREIEDPPEDSLGRLRLGVMLVSVERNEDALEQLRKALDLALTQNAADLQCAAHVALGQVLINLGRKGEACNDFRAAVDLQIPDFSDKAKKLLADAEME